MRIFLSCVVVCIVSLKSVSAWDEKMYTCTLCRNVIAYSGLAVGKFSDFCYEKLGHTACDAIFGKDSPTMNSDISKTDDFCFVHHLCNDGEKKDRNTEYSDLSTNSVNVRVTRAMGTKGYNKVRVSMVTNSSISPSEFTLPNAYINQFKYRWTEFYLATAVVDIVPGEVTKVKLNAHQDVNVFVPKENEGTRGIIVADPCFQSEWVNCHYQDAWDMFGRLTALLNAANSHADTHFWQILGDNFYDQQGAATNTWFNALSLETKSKVMAAVPGNHDTWVAGSPKVFTKDDQLQNGFYQYYGQDTVASLVSPLIPYDFSVNPSGPDLSSATLPPASNLFTFNKVGNMIFVGFSGAHEYETQKTYFADACKFAQSAGADVILLEGHWNGDGDGCSSSAVPEVYKAISSLPECAPVAHKIKYAMGHQHCNQVTEKDIGFMVGAMGMSDKQECGGVFGIPVFDTTGGRFKVYYFQINDEKKKMDYYDETLKCFQEKGVSGCYGLSSVQVWADLPL